MSWKVNESKLGLYIVFCIYVEFGGVSSPLPPPPSIPLPSPEPTPKRVVVAVYNFTPTEDEDLALLQVSFSWKDWQAWLVKYLQKP